MLYVVFASPRVTSYVTVAVSAASVTSAMTLALVTASVPCSRFKPLNRVREAMLSISFWRLNTSSPIAVRSDADSVL